MFQNVYVVNTLKLNYSNIRCASVTGNRVGTSVSSNTHMIISMRYYNIIRTIDKHKMIRSLNKMKAFKHKINIMFVVQY